MVKPWREIEQALKENDQAFMRNEQAFTGNKQLSAGDQQALGAQLDPKQQLLLLVVKEQHGKLCIGEKIHHIPVLLS